MQINIYVTKTELLKELNRYTRDKSLKILEDCKTDLIKLYGGLSVHPTFKGHWLDNGILYTDINEIWEILTDKATYEATTKQLNQIVLSIKTLTKQKAQLITLNPSVEPIFLTETL
jgi:hypothetical protein